MALQLAGARAGKAFNGRSGNLLQRPGVAVGVADGDKRAPRLYVDVADLHAVGDELLFTGSSFRGLTAGHYGKRSQSRGTASPSNRASRASYGHPLSTRLVSDRRKGARPVRLPEQEADDAIAEASHALKVLPTGQVDTASRIAAAQVRAIAALAGAVDRLAYVLDQHLPQIAGSLGPTQ